MMEARLLATADDLCRATGRRPREAFMRRAVSTAYYALFHALGRMCADELIGRANAKTDAYARIYRALDHGAAKRALSSPAAAALDPRIEALATAFATLQQKRHRADYDPRPFGHVFEDTRAAVAQARLAVSIVGELDPQTRRTLATLILFPGRGRESR